LDCPAHREIVSLQVVQVVGGNKTECRARLVALNAVRLHLANRRELRQTELALSSEHGISLKMQIRSWLLYDLNRSCSGP
jgi:hypothetical protein